MHNRLTLVIYPGLRNQGRRLSRSAPKEEIRDSYRKEENPIFDSFHWLLDEREMALEPLPLRTEENNHRNEETRRGMLIRASNNTASAAY
ncbi:hypothetical protein AAC387_Pa07g2030 [Persea americana]